MRFRGTFDQGFYNDPNLPGAARKPSAAAGRLATSAPILSVAQFLLGGIREVTASAQTCLRQRPVPQTDAGMPAGSRPMPSGGKWKMTIRFSARSISTAAPRG